MTEDEAKTKWCPAIRIGAESDMSYACTNREERLGDRPPLEASRCIGSACMAWRETGSRLHRIDNADQRLSYERSGWEITVTAQGAVAHEPSSGYCGLAGAPS